MLFVRGLPIYSCMMSFLAVKQMLNGKVSESVLPITPLVCLCIKQAPLVISSFAIGYGAPSLTQSQ